MPTLSLSVKTSLWSSPLGSTEGQARSLHSVSSRANSTFVHLKSSEAGESDCLSALLVLSLLSWEMESPQKDFEGQLKSYFPSLLFGGMPFFFFSFFLFTSLKITKIIKRRTKLKIWIKEVWEMWTVTVQSLFPHSYFAFSIWLINKCCLTECLI